jgi:cell division protein FtsI (penicillin-binding protein 3)
MRSADLHSVARRTRISAALLLLGFLALAARAAHLSVIDRRGIERGRAQTGTVLRLAPARGLIVDKTGAELAVTVPAPSVYAVPREVESPAQAAALLSRALGLPARELRAQLARKAPFVFVKRWLTPDQAAAVSKLELAGVGIVEEPRRTYPQGALAGALLGFSNIDGVGSRGIEQMEDDWLAGKAQRVAVERDAKRRLLAFADFDPRRSAGGDVALTLDTTLQAEAEAGLAEVVKATGARGGLVIALDAPSGDLLALAESPGFDPNRFRATRYADTRSRSFLDAADPGSTAKPFTVAAALEAGVLRTDEIIDCESFHIPGKTVRDVHPHERLDPAGILRVSSNVGASRIAFRVGPERHYTLLRSFGFGRPSGSRFPDESAGLLRPWQDWRPVDHATIAFGQGMAVTPIQLASAFAVLASGGEWRAPRLVAARRDPNGVWEHLPPSPPRRVLSRQVAHSVLGMLETVVGPEGTGRRAGLRGIRVAGKTGTAQKLEADGSYSTRRFQAWFAGAVPADAPRFVIVAMIDEPRGFVHTGGATSAPLFARIAAAALAREGILTEPELPLPEFAHADWVPPWQTHKTAAVASAPPKPAEAPRHRVTQQAARSAARSEPEANGGTSPARSAARSEPQVNEVHTLGDRILLPDFRGLTPGQVRRQLSGLGIALQVSGTGRAIAQEPAPGTILRGGAVRIRFDGGGGAR